MNRPTRHQKQLSGRNRGSNRGEGFDFVRCRICGDHRLVISGRHLCKHGTDREEYIEEYGLSPDELISKDFRIIQISRRGYKLYGKKEWIVAIKKIHKHGSSVFAGDLQDKHPYLYNQGVWIFGDWDKALRGAGIDDNTLKQLQRIDDELMQLCKRLRFIFSVLASSRSWMTAGYPANDASQPCRRRP